MKKEGKILWAINTTIDGFADHTAGIADEELHLFFADLLQDTDIMLFGRKTYKLLEDFWPTAKDIPSCPPAMIKFADRINSMQKMVVSETLKNVLWNNTTIISGNMVSEITKLKHSGKRIAIGSLSIASCLLKENLIDEMWFLIHPVLLGKGVTLTDKIIPKINLQLTENRVFNSGVIAAHYVISH